MNSLINSWILFFVSISSEAADLIRPYKLKGKVLITDHDDDDDNDDAKYKMVYHKIKTFRMHSTIRQAGQLVDNIPYTASKRTEFHINIRCRSMCKCMLVSFYYAKRLKPHPIKTVWAVYLRVS